MLQETVWAPSNIQLPLHQVSVINSKIVSKVSIISKFEYHLKVSIIEQVILFW